MLALGTRRSTLAVTLLAGALFAGSPAWGQGHSTGFRVDQTPQADGGYIYSLNVSYNGIASDGSLIDDALLIAPNGTEYVGPRTTIEGTTFDDLAATLFGDWTIITRPQAGPESSYDVRVVPTLSMDDFEPVRAEKVSGTFSPKMMEKVPDTFFLLFPSPFSFSAECHAAECSGTAVSSSGRSRVCARQGSTHPRRHM